MPEKSLLENALAIVGGEDVVLGFKALGFKTYAIKEPKELGMLLAELAGNKTGICLVQDEFYRAAHDAIGAYKGLPLPIIIPFAKSGTMGELDKLVTDIRLRATGVL